MYLEKLLEDVLLTASHKGFSNLSHFYKYVLITVLLYASMIGLNILIYNIVDKKISTEDKERYANNIMTKSYCRSILSSQHFKFLADKCMMDSVTLAVCFGVLITLIYTKGSYNPQNWSTNYKNLPHYKKLLRILVTAFVCMIPLGMTFFLKFDNIYL